ncbi:hypothetical protein RI129_004242 [Pyrocoelia pectoralis]|uniref:DNA polymerase n=1 Tax=Pyrocoelia pectoralis TaxID=417401 RepID=A0AAN7VFE5_9COLE
MEGNIDEPRAKRQKKDRSGKSAAFEKLKQLKGSKNKYEVSDVDNVYEIVDEREYTKKVLGRQDEDWIVDDDGSGYIEDGRDIFDDDLDAESLANAASSKKAKNRKKSKGISENAGKGNLQYLISNMPTKKKDEVKLGEDDVLSDLLLEIDDNAPGKSKSENVIKPKPTAKFSLSADKKAAKDYMKSFSLPTLKPETTPKIPQAPKLEEIESMDIVEDSQHETDPPKQLTKVESFTIEDIQSQFEDDFDVIDIQDTSQDITVVEQKSDVTEEQLSSGWETLQEGTLNAPQTDIYVDYSQIPTVKNSEGHPVFRFFWWDAYENIAKRPGEIFLFGKTYCDTVKSYVSCLTKRYCFNPDVPTESEYLEIRYSGKNPRLDADICKDGGKTFSCVFGSRSSFLEIFLLERKIKGPCWLDVISPEPVHNPISYCKFEIHCSKPMDISIVRDTLAPPPLVTLTINMQTVVNTTNMHNEIVMMSFLVHSKYAVDKKPPNPLFEQHFCVFTRPGHQNFPFDLHGVLQTFTATRVQKMDSERALLNYFLLQIQKIDPDIIVGHDLQDYQIGLLCERLLHCKSNNISRLSKIKRADISNKHLLEKDLFVGRLVSDIKVSSKELIKSRSYDLGTICQNVLKLPQGERREIENDEVFRFYQCSADILQLITFTMQDAAYILKIMYELNIIPLALQITNIAGNVMSRTLLGGRSERNELLLLHAFSERDYIVPEKVVVNKDETDWASKKATTSKRKPAYSGGLVLDPKVGFYDKLVLLMDFNSLYPSIIQEYNICFTTISGSDSEENVSLPDQQLPQGILPTEIRKLVESRRSVKNLMNNPDLAPDLRMQYNIRQMALKLTANSMYGCLGFVHSRFYAKNLAALVTFKGREILTNTKDLVEKMQYQVIYGDTDSIMINTNTLEYDDVFKIGVKIKQEVNKLYKQIELDIDGVFKYLLLLKKKKYAAVVITKGRNNQLQFHQEHKGLDIVRRDWSQLAAAAGKFTLDNILNDQTYEDRIENIHTHLAKLKEDLDQNKVPLSLLVITKQLTKDPRLYANHTQFPHVQVALRYNKRGGRVFKAGDIVSYIICEDGTNAPATQRAYHIDELKNSENLKIDVRYYLGQQIHPVVSRLCEPLEGTDPYQIANCLGLDTTNFKKPIRNVVDSTDNLLEIHHSFTNAEPFIFRCVSCKVENKITGIYDGSVPFLKKCINPECNVSPIDYLGSVANQLTLSMRGYIKKYYRNQLTCEDPACTNETVRVPLKFVGKYPVCTFCKKGVMYQKYTEGDLYNQLRYFQHIFDLGKLDKRPILDGTIESGYHTLKETVEKVLKHSGYAMIDLTKLFSSIFVQDRDSVKLSSVVHHSIDEYEDDFADF